MKQLDRVFFVVVFGRGGQGGSVIFQEKQFIEFHHFLPPAIMLCGLMKSVDSRVRQLLARTVSVIDFLCLVISTRVVGLVMLEVD